MNTVLIVRLQFRVKLPFTVHLFALHLNSLGIHMFLQL